MSSDERLVKRATQGDPRAFEAIYRRYHQDLYRFCLAMVGNAQDAQDALQNTMVKVLRALPGEEREIQLKPWLYRIARNESVETLRKRRDNAQLQPHQAIGSGVIETAETRERLRVLLADLEQLPERQRAVLVMRELSGLDFDQIGASFDTSPAVARQTLYEARLSLRQLEAGREMRCADVMKELSNGDGRVTRRREIRAHLRGCADCRAFRDDIGKRHEDLAALAPLPLAASAALLQGVLGKASATGAAAVGGGGVAGGIGVGGGQAVATSVIVKSAATVAVVAVVGVSAADRGGVIDLPLAGKSGSDATQKTAKPTDHAGAVDSAESASAVSAKTESVASQRPDGETSAQSEEGRQDKVDGQSQDGGKAARDNPSNSQAGQNPPGGGHGRSASKRNGRPDGLPQAADHGQQTAAAKKPAHAASPPDKGGSGGGKGNNSGGGGSDRSAAKPEPPSTTKGPPVTPAPPPTTGGPSQADSGFEEQGPGAAPPGLQR
jgi:RNA polymerase sigma factor (sigma-70 family)